MHLPIKCFCGKEAFDETCAIDQQPSDDGNDAKELIIKNYPGEKAVISSGVAAFAGEEGYQFQ